MTDVDLTGDIALAIDAAAQRESALALAYVDADGKPHVAFRGSTQVHGSDQLALWARKRDDGLVVAIAERPDVALVYYSPDTPGAIYLAIQGRARVAPELNDTVYERMIEGEQAQDPDRDGIAVVIDVDSVEGAGPSGMIHQQRA
jgi:hypothetical protein